ncbi:hypothetical protein V5O48_010488 [Marasmius crinis-equi]|uniref:Uncharacterized protein n=1 Tax=Marasmius crinis-equi TaxID=585013 RepID=A0ABR3F8A1_9AGAR
MVLDTLLVNTKTAESSKFASRSEHDIFYKSHEALMMDLMKGQVQTVVESEIRSAFIWCLQMLSTYALQGHVRYFCGRPLHFMIKPIANKHNYILNDVGDYGGWVGGIGGMEKVIASVCLGATGGGNAEKGKAVAFTRHVPTKEMWKSKAVISG